LLLANHLRDASPLGVANEDLTLNRVIPGVGLTRTLPPVLPPNFLSRKSILADVAIELAGLTLVAAPAGYGKTSLVAEYVATLDLPVIWITFNDSDDAKSFAAHFVQAIRNVFPEFGQWFSLDEEVVLKVFLAKTLQEIGQIPEKIVLVLDNNRVKHGDGAPFAELYLNLVPTNVHTIAIRRDIPSQAFTHIKSLPNINIFEKHDIEFSDEEIAVIAQQKGISLDDTSNSEALKNADGWPAAVQLILNNISRGRKSSTNAKINIGSSEQIRLLVEDLLSTLKPEEREILEALSVIEEFSNEEARIILQDKFSISVLNHFAIESLFIKHTADPIQNYAFNSVVRAGLAISPAKSESQIQAIHHRLSAYYSERGSYLKALEHAKSSGDQASYRTLFRQGMRQLIAIGRGKDLLRMAEFVGDSSKAGRLKRQTVELIGLTADFQYLNAQSLIAEMLFTAQGTDLENFIKKFTAAVSVYIDFATGLTESLEENVSSAISAPSQVVDLAPLDKISILRVAAAKELIYDNSNKILEIEKQANSLAVGDTNVMVMYFTSAIHACALLNQGEYKDAFIIANKVISMAEREGYVGIFGPLDAMYVKARCLLEFSQIEESQFLFEQIRNLATTWHQHIWVYVAESFMARDLALAGNSASALEIVRSGRGRALSLTFKNGLDTYCDLTELFIKFTMKDWGRVGVLLERLPNFLLVERVRAIYEVAIGKTPSEYIISKLPMSSATEQIYRYMALAEENIDREKEAVKYMRSALEIGSRVGAKETFLRQDASLLNLVIRIAGDNPTVYLEDLTSRIPERLKARNENLIGLSAALTKRELEILRHLATGKPISAIAITLHISQNTMKTHLKNVYRKIGAAGRDEAVAKAKNLYIL